MKQDASSITREDKSMTTHATCRMKGIPSLLFSILLVVVFIFYVCPLMDKLPLVEPLIEFIDEQNIDAGALYYTEIEEFSDAEVTMRNTMSFAPGK
jgi:hypothetical protein